MGLLVLSDGSLSFHMHFKLEHQASMESLLFLLHLLHLLYLTQELSTNPREEREGSLYREGDSKMRQLHEREMCVSSKLVSVPSGTLTLNFKNHSLFTLLKPLN